MSVTRDDPHRGARPRRGRGRDARARRATARSRTCSCASTSRRASSRRSCAAARFTEAPDITARICGICPVAYQMSSCAAMEDACGVEVAEPIRALRRLLYCGEWIESHALHVFMLHAPDFLGYESAFEMAARPPRRRRARRCALKKAGNALMRVVGGREIHPINVRVGGFYRAPDARASCAPLVEQLERAREFALEAVRWTAALPFPDFEEDYEFVALRASRRVRDRGRPAASRAAGSTSRPREYEEHFVEEHVAALDRAALAAARRRRATSSGRWRATRSTATGCRRWPARRPTRPASSRSAATRSAASSCARSRSSTRSTRRCGSSTAYEPPDPPAVEVRAARRRRATAGPRRRAACSATATRIDDDGHDPRREDRAADLAEPGARSRTTCAASCSAHVDLPDDELQLRCEQAIRNYDPCISCATHFLRPGGRPRVTLVIGVGNAWRGDDGAGLAVARRVRELAPRRRRPRGRGRRDRAARRAGRAPSTSSSSTPPRRARRRARCSASTRAPQPLPARSAALLDARASASRTPIELARALGRLPARLDVYAIEGASFTPASGLSPAVERAVAELAASLASARR